MLAKTLCRREVNQNPARLVLAQNGLRSESNLEASNFVRGKIFPQNSLAAACLHTQPFINLQWSCSVLNIKRSL